MYRSKSQFQFLARLMALVMLLSQSVFALASINSPMSHSMDMMPASDNVKAGCHSMTNMAAKDAMDHEQHAAESGIDKQDKSCQQDCCDKNDCASHCQSCFSVSAGMLIPAIQQIQQFGLTESLILKSDQIPSGLEPAHLYRPPRQAI